VLRETKPTLLHAVFHIVFMPKTSSKRALPQVFPSKNRRFDQMDNADSRQIDMSLEIYGCLQGVCMGNETGNSAYLAYFPGYCWSARGHSL
jgi:hypothetical protein